MGLGFRDCDRSYDVSDYKWAVQIESGSLHRYASRPEGDKW